MVTPTPASSGHRNAAIFAATALTVGLLMLYPTSTDQSRKHRIPGQALAPVGIVAGGPSTPTSSPGTKPSRSPTPVHLVVNGTSVVTKYGPVQIQIVIKNHRITKALALDYPQGDGRSQQISAAALPVLESETVSAQSAHIDAVSGATYTSDGYRQSLQAAIDAAHLS
jgi:uncharacterized protein with FMN-binding domain